MKKEKAKEPAPGASEPRFEEAMAELEGIVRQLEGGEASLDESLAAYEKGVQCVKHCQKLLDLAEQRVNELTGVDADGGALTKPFEK